MAATPKSLLLEPTVVETASPPRRVGQYDLLEPIGRGGMGIVWKGMHRHLQQVVAIKFLAPEAWGDPQAVARFYSEMRAVGRVAHQHIVRALDAGEYDGQHVLVMEYVAGVTIRDLLRRAGPFDVAIACEIMRQAALGLTAIHAAGIIHRDLKPSNLLLSDSGLVKILDLGLARGIGEQHEGELTASGDLLGTVDYMSPEQSSDPRAVDARADLYSLGCTFYAILTGEPPFSGPEMSFESRLRAHREAVPRPVREYRANLPPAVDEMVLKLLAKAPADRPQSAEELVAGLAPFAAGGDLLAWKNSLPQEADSFFVATGNSPRRVASGAVPTSSTPGLVANTTRREGAPSAAQAPAIDEPPKRRAFRTWGAMAVGLVCLSVLGGLAAYQFTKRPAVRDDLKVRPSAEQAENESPSAVALRDFSDIPPRTWQKLLDRQPIPIFWNPGEGLARHEWSQPQQQLLVTNDKTGVIGLGTTSAQDFSLQVGIHQNRWSSGVGVFLGLAGWQPESPDATWNCLWLHIVEVRDLGSVPTYRVDLDRIQSKLSGDGRRIMISNSFASESIGTPVGEIMLEVVVSEGNLSRVRLDGKNLSEIIATANSQSQPLEWSGGFGILVDSGNATIRNSQFMSNRPDRS